MERLSSQGVKGGVQPPLSRKRPPDAMDMDDVNRPESDVDSIVEDYRKIKKIKSRKVSLGHWFSFLNLMSVNL